MSSDCYQILLIVQLTRVEALSHFKLEQRGSPNNENELGFSIEHYYDTQSKFLLVKDNHDYI